MNVLYRVVDSLQSTGEGYPSRVGVSIHSFEIEKETPCGYWIGSRWVSKTSKKRFAHPTKAEAIISFRKRKERQISILTAQLRQAHEALEISEKDFLDCTFPLE
jgi:hypothetical protein